MVIVTTAVYWGLNSKLHPEGLTPPLNLPAPGGVSPYTSNCLFARTRVFSKQSLPTGLCGHHTLSGVNPYKWMAPLLPKLRGHFAEFLHHDSLDLLSILYLTTCVGLGYGRLKPRVDAFLGSIGSLTSPYGSPSHLTLK